MRTRQKRPHKANQQAVAARDSKIQAGREQEKQILAQARADVSDKLAQGRDGIDQSCNQTEQQLQPMAQTLGSELAGKILGRGV